MRDLQNHVLVRLASNAGASDVQLHVAGAASPFLNPPDPAAGSGLAVLTLGDDPRTPTRLEIVTYTTRTLNPADGSYILGGVSRAQESTSALSWVAGEWAFQEITEDVLSSITIDLDARLTTVETDLTTVETEVVAARDGEASLLDQINALQSRLADLEDLTFAGVTLDAIADTIAATAVALCLYNTAEDDDPNAMQSAGYPVALLLVATSTEVSIRDATSPSTEINSIAVSSPRAVVARNGFLWVGTGSSLARYDLLNNAAAKSLTADIVNSQVNDLAVVVLPDTPIDPVRGMRTPTVAVATDGGVSVVHADGSVVDQTYTIAGNVQAGRVAFPPDGGLLWATRDYSTDDFVYISRLNAIPTADDATYPDTHYRVNQFSGESPAGALTLPGATSQANSTINDMVASGNLLAVGRVCGLSLIREDPDTPASGLVAHITSTYNTGWMLGNTRIALTPNVAGTVADRSIAGRSITGTYTVAAVATGADLQAFTGATNITATLAADISSSGALVWWEKVAGAWHMYIDDLAGGTDYDNGHAGTPSGNVSVSGTAFTVTSGAEVTLVRAFSVPPSADQVAAMYDDERRLFQAGAGCLLPTGSDNVSAVADNAWRDTLHVGTGAGRAVFDGLANVDEDTTAAVTQIAALGATEVVNR